MKTSIYSFLNLKLYSEIRWFWTLNIFLLTLVAIYIAAHHFTRELKIDYEYAKLSDHQIQLINRIYFDTLTVEGPQQVAKLEQDTLAPLGQKPAEKVQVNQLAFVQAAQDVEQSENARASKHIKALRFIDNEFNNKVDRVQLDSIRLLLASASDLEATSYLDEARFVVKSYFWLTGPAIYYEIVFWSIFGVLASLLFNLGMVSKNSTTVPGDPHTQFDSSEIPYQCAKILYAPICTLAIVLGYNFFNDSNMADINSGKGVIAFAFIGGFYSSRVIAFLDRLKEVILPTSALSGAGSSSTTTNNIPPDVYNPTIDTPPPPPSATTGS
ncbi:hypothetical protein [Pedobacter sp. SYSU D00535]|uniref:hypothetical protein n=1 Tax=Pedobacter sp. SYSU D00535 TaxID=2810308 RepID=UPI001A963644|nr:hypothetical protein [Pedobacter sp. SYSU D00535]